MAKRLKRAPVVEAPAATVRRNLHLPARLDLRVREKARELGYTYGTVVQMALHEWVYLRNPASYDDPLPAIRHTQPPRTPTYTFLNDDGKKVTVPWATVKVVGEYRDAHPKHLTGRIVTELGLPFDEVEAAFDAYTTEWYADQLEKLEGK